MDNLVSINNTKENILKFNLSIEGINPSDITAKFVIHGQNMELGFRAERVTGDEWTIEIPALPVLERTAYPFHFDIVADGYHFEPLRGTCNVVGGNDVYITTPKNPKIAAEAGPKEEKKEEPKKESIAVPNPADLPKKGKERPIAQVAQELMEANKKKVEVKSEPVVKPILTEAPVPVIAPTLTSILPKIAVEKKDGPKVGDKDEAARKVLEDMGIKTKKSKPHARFSLKN